MRQELNDRMLEEVTGGSVTLSKPMNMCGFTTLGKIYKIKGDFALMRNRLFELYDEHSDMSDKAFDTLVRDEFQARGWI